MGKILFKETKLTASVLGRILTGKERVCKSCTVFARQSRKSYTEKKVKFQGKLVIYFWIKVLQKLKFPNLFTKIKPNWHKIFDERKR
jgi:hypothetical protein